MVADACTASYTADINLVSGTTATGITRERVDSLGEPISGVWSRVADEVSEARVVIDTSGDCGSQLNRWYPYMGFIELVINRDGETVWAGPITDIGQGRRGQPAAVVARDIAYWLGRAQLWGTGYTGTGDVATIAQAALTQSLTTTSIPAPIFRRDSGLVMAHWGWTPVGETITYVEDNPATTPLAVLDDLTAYGLTWSVAGYRLLGGPRPGIDTVPTETVAEQDFTDELDVSVSIEDITTHATAENNDGSVRRSSNVSGQQLPRLETVVNAGDVTDPETIRIPARRALNWPVRPVVASPEGRMMRIPDFSRALPGRVVWEVQTEFLGQRVRQSMHLESIQVDWVADGAEDVKPGLTPIGTAVPIDV